MKKVIVLGLMLCPIAFISGCGCAKKCGNSEPVMQHKLDKMKKEYGGKGK